MSSPALATPAVPRNADPTRAAKDIARVLIIGFGNPSRSDDGLGWHVARQLARDLSASDVRVIAAQQLTPEMAEFASRAETLLFIDASRQGQPGSLRCQPVSSATSPSGYSHDLSPAVILELAQELYGYSPPAHLLTITGANFETGESLSPTVLASIPALLAQVANIVKP